MSRISILKPPLTDYTSIEDVGKFNMLWHVSVGLIFVFAFLFGFHVLFRDANWSTSFAAFSLAMSNVLVLRITRRYKTVAIWSTVLGILIVQASVYLVADSHIITDTMWCILIGFFTFFLFGPIPGTIVLLINLGGLVGFLFFCDEVDVLNKGLTMRQVDVRMLINVFYVALALSFIIYKMILNNREIIRMHEVQTVQNEVLLKEIHHRVKNNLQIVSSLLKLQAAENQDSAIREQFDEAISRIRAMALIHERMYTNDDFSAIDIQSYTFSLIQDIISSLRPDCHVDVQIESEVHKVDIKSMVPVSLIFNELTTNSLKHAFEGRNKGRILVNIERAGNQILLYYSDNGAWKQPKKGNGFGLELIGTLTEQLHGQMERTINADGTHYRFALAADQFYFRD